MHADPARPLFTGKTLQYVEQSIAHWVMSTGALAVMIPSPTGATQRGDVTLDHYAQWLDGLVLHGGADVSPLSATARSRSQDEWAGDRIRDEYEIDLVAAFERHGKPVFGVCRGLQLLNVAYRRHALPGHRDANPRGAAASRRAGLRQQLPRRGVRARLAPGGDVPRRQAREGQQHPPPGHQGPGARFRGRGA